jgi:putative ABC transport system substrate-binding protein
MMRRREFIALVGGAATLPFNASAQTTMPVIGFLDSRSSDSMASRLAGFRQGLNDVFAAIGQERPDALFVGAAAFLNIRRVQLAQLAAFYRLPAIYSFREAPEVGGLVSYGPSISDAYRQWGIYAGRILKGAKPADLPVMQTSKFELVFNLTTARLLGLTVPPSLLAIADEVIE